MLERHPVGADLAVVAHPARRQEVAGRPVATAMPESGGGRHLVIVDAVPVLELLGVAGGGVGQHDDDVVDGRAVGAGRLAGCRPGLGEPPRPHRGVVEALPGPDREIVLGADGFSGAGQVALDLVEGHELPRHNQIAPVGVVPHPGRRVHVGVGAAAVALAADHPVARHDLVQVRVIPVVVLLLVARHRVGEHRQQMSCGCRHGLRLLRTLIAPVTWSARAAPGWPRLRRAPPRWADGRRRRPAGGPPRAAPRR